MEVDKAVEVEGVEAEDAEVEGEEEVDDEEEGGEGEYEVEAILDHTQVKVSLICFAVLTIRANTHVGVRLA